MSVQALTAAIAVYSIHYREKAVLLVLANYADEEMKCWPSVARLAKEACMNERTCQRALAELERLGFITRQVRPCADGRQRTSLYTLRLGMGVYLSPQPEPGVTKKGGEGCQIVHDRGDTAVTLTVIEPSLEPSKNPPLDSPLGFSAFWDAYPRKVGKLAAEKAYASALKKTDSDALLAGAIRYAREQRGKDPVYIAHASTWLNRGSWLDEPQKPRSYDPSTTFPP